MNLIQLLYITWNPDLVIFHLGPVVIRWYSTLWLIGLLLAYLIVRHLYKKQNIADEKFDPLLVYCFLGILIGARLGHCIFYQPEYFLSSGTHMLEMILPMRYGMDGSWHFTGYEGLASHGGTIGIIIALLLYCRNLKMNAWTVLDNISIAVPTTACCIRLGNLMNSEIIGKPTDVPWAFIFERVDMQPRHPGQLYEAIAYACFFFVLWYFWKKKPQYVGTGFFFGLDLALIFTFRFFIEYTKELQVAFEASLPIDMGQILSIPFIIIGISCTIGGSWLVKLGAKEKL
jgi:prolipoprotein diacylglyceryl transferase